MYLSSSLASLCPSSNQQPLLSDLKYKKYLARLKVKNNLNISATTTTNVQSFAVMIMCKSNGKDCVCSELGQNNSDPIIFTPKKSPKIYLLVSATVDTDTAVVPSTLQLQLQTA